MIVSLLFFMSLHDFATRKVPSHWITMLFICSLVAYEVQDSYETAGLVTSYVFWKGLERIVSTLSRKPSLGKGDINILVSLMPCVPSFLLPLWFMILGLGGVIIGVLSSRVSSHKAMPFVPVIFLSFLGLEIIKILL